MLTTIGSGPVFGSGLRVLPIVVLTVAGVGLVPAYGPARRGLAVEPTEALRHE